MDIKLLFFVKWIFVKIIIQYKLRKTYSIYWMHFFLGLAEIVKNNSSSAEEHSKTLIGVNRFRWLIGRINKQKKMHLVIL